MALTKITGDVIATNTSITAVGATFTGNVSVAGTITYEDVTDIDSVGLITARSGVNITGGGLIVTGVSTVSAGSTSAPSISPSGDANTGIFFPSADTIAFGEGGSEAARFDSSGRLLVGTSSASYTTTAVFEGNSSSDTEQAQIYLNKGDTTVSSDTVLGILRFGASGDLRGADVRGIGDGTWTGSSTPGRLSFMTTASGATAPTERMRIDSSGRVGIDNTTPGSYNAGGDDLVVGDNSGNRGITIAGGSTGESGLYFADGSTGGEQYAGLILYDHTTDSLRLWANANERARIDSSGRFGLGTSTPGEPLTVQCATDQGLMLQSYETVTGAINTGPYIYGNISDGSTARSAGSIAFLKENGTSGNYATYMAFRTRANGASPAEQMRIDSSGRLLVGTTTTSSNNLLVVSGTTGGNPGFVQLQTEATTPGSTEQIGGINFGTAADVSAARIIGYRDSGTWTAGSSTPTALTFFTTADGSSNPTERMRIHSNGKISSNNWSVDGHGTGSAATTYIGMYASGGNSVGFATLGSERARIDSSGRLLVGTSSNITSSLIQSHGTGSNAIGVGRFAANAFGPEISFYKSRNATIGSNTIVQNGDYLGANVFWGANGSGYNAGASISARVDGTPGVGDMPTRLEFSTTKDGNSSPTLRMMIDDEGIIYTVSENHGINVHVTASAGTVKYIYRGTHSATAGSIASGTIAFNVWSNGNVENTNNSYGAISDIKLKENIVDASSQWSDLKAIQVRNYNFKEETGQQTHTQLGVIAQEVELVSPGLVTESPDLDAEGNDLGTTTKSVNYSVLYMKAVKALQEAQTRIETLETENAAILARLDAAGL